MNQQWAAFATALLSYPQTSPSNRAVRHLAHEALSMVPIENADYDQLRRHGFLDQ